MSRLDDLYRLHRLLDGRRVGISRAALIQDHGFSRSTLSRIISEMREHLGAPLEHDPDRGGYLYDTTDGRHHLPGLWLRADELAALVTIQTLLRDLAPGLLEPAIRPLRDRIAKILESEHLGSGEAERRIRLLALATRGAEPARFRIVAAAVLGRKRLRIRYYNRERNETGDRTVSPQRLARYRDNWYLDAWCHARQALRVFAVECIREADLLDEPAKAMADSALDQELATAYGIFAGAPSAEAVLVFTAYRARWVADEIWHPQQQSRWLPDGRYELRVPYSDERELLMDVLKYGPDVEVAGPSKLREAAWQRLEAAANQYQHGRVAGSVFGTGGE
jgi:proteasome accessory factor C